MKLNNLKKRNILYSKIISIILLAFFSIIFVSCEKETQVIEGSKSGIKIKIEDYGNNTDVKSSNTTPAVYQRVLRVDDEYAATIKILEDRGKDDLYATTKAGESYTYTILAFLNGTTFKKSMSGTINNEGDFHIDDKSVVGNIDVAGTYKFVCVANGTLSSDKKTITFSRRNQSTDKPALISDVISMTITDSEIKNNKQLDLNFLMRHKESGIQVQVNSEENIPSGFRIILSSPSQEPNSNSYNVLSPGTRTPVSSSSLSLSYATSGTGTSKNLTTDFMYLLEGTGLRNNLELSFSGASTLCGYSLSKIKSVLSNLPVLPANRRYIVTLTFKKNGSSGPLPGGGNGPDSDIPIMTPNEIKELPAWRWANRNMKNMYALVDNELDKGTQVMAVASGIVREFIRGKSSYKPNGVEYFLPKTEEYRGIFLKENLSLSVTPTEFTEVIAYGNAQEEFNVLTWKKSTTEAYAIKLYNNTGYSRACAYRWQFINFGNEGGQAHVMITVIYLGSEAEKYVKNKNKTGIEGLFNNLSSYHYRILKFPAYAFYREYGEPAKYVGEALGYYLDLKKYDATTATNERYENLIVKNSFTVGFEDQRSTDIYGWQEEGYSYRLIR